MPARGGERVDVAQQRHHVLQVLDREAGSLVHLEEAVAHAVALAREGHAAALGGGLAVEPVLGRGGLELVDQLAHGLGAAW